MSNRTEDERLLRLEYAIFGLRGDNGLASEVRQLREEIIQYRKEDAERREEERKERKEYLRWQIATTVAVVTAIIMASGIIVGLIG